MSFVAFSAPFQDSARAEALVHEKFSHDNLLPLLVGHRLRPAFPRGSQG